MNILRELRRKNHYTQEEIAKYLGYKSKSGYSMLENDKVRLTIDKAKLLAKLYKVNISDFF